MIIKFNEYSGRPVTIDDERVRRRERNLAVRVGKIAHSPVRGFDGKIGRVTGDSVTLHDDFYLSIAGDVVSASDDFYSSESRDELYSD